MSNAKHPAALYTFLILLAKKQIPTNCPLKERPGLGQEHTGCWFSPETGQGKHLKQVDSSLP